MSLLTVSGVSKRIQETVLLNRVSFDLESLQNTAITGETGSGKSTLLKIISGLEQADSGAVFFEGARVKGLHEKLMPGHPGIAYLTQSHELRKRYRVEELLAYANDLTDSESALLYEKCRISHLLERQSDQLSGGERQRIALAILLTTRPRLLVMDEPFSNLDPIHKRLLSEVIRDIGESLRITCIMASHDPADTLSWAERILVMKDGEIVQSGSPEEIYHHPVNVYVAGLFGGYNLLSRRQLRFWPGLPDPGPEAEEHSVIIRPEQFRIVPESRDTVAGTIRKRTFAGGFYEAEVSIYDFLVRIRTMDHCPPEGSTVHLSYAPR